MPSRSSTNGEIPPRWRGRLFLAPGLVLYLGPGEEVGTHAHHAVQLVWAPGGRFSLALPGRRAEVGAALVPANVPHAFSARGRRLALLLAERHGRVGLALDRAAREQRGADLSARLRGLSLPPPGVTVAGAMAWCEAVLAALGVPRDGPRPSRGVRLAIAYVERSLDGRPRVALAAARAALSASRLTHRFTAEVGIPFRRFVLWSRLKRAVELSRGGANLTEAAIGAGFSDSAHLSRTFRATFGLSPSLVLGAAEISGGWVSPGGPP